MKINPKEINEDLCSVSIELLEKNIKNYLTDKLNVEFFWIPDQEHGFPANVNTTTPVDVILLGGFLSCFFATGNWPDLRYRLWVVSKSVRDVLVNLLQIAPKHISVLPRYELFPASQAVRSLEINNDAFDLVYAGRISSVKNIEATLWLVYFLQTRHNIQAKLFLIGDFDNMIAADRGRREIFSFEAQIKKLIQSLNWKIEPELIARMGPEEWHQKNFNKPVLINLSTFMCEDFSVSLAQAQQQGWPSIITDWGGNRDQNMDNALIIPWPLVGRNDEPKNVIELKSEILAQYLLSALNTRRPRPPSAYGGLRAPEPISIYELDKARRKVLNKLGPDSYLIEKEGLAAFADKESGRTFFANYRTMMGETNLAEKSLSVVLINDLNETKNVLSKEILDNISSIKKTIPADNTTLLISTREALFVDNLTLIFQCNTIYFSFFINETFALLKNVLLTTNSEAKIIIYLLKSSSLETKQRLAALKNTDHRITFFKAEL